MSTKSGLTLIEILIVLSIAVVISSLVIGGYSSFRRTVTLRQEAERVVSLISKARSNTLSSKNDLRYGIHFESNKLVMFSGDTYIDGAVTNETNFLEPKVSISNIVFNGGGTDILFNRLDGTTLYPGYIELTIGGDLSSIKRISISSNGVINVQ